ncbi:MAG: family 1 glycosylhydrolase [Deltaproteobacteria bacterium]
MIPKTVPVREALGRVTSDYLGINYYTKGYLKWRALSEMQQDFPIQVQFYRGNEPKSDLDWAIHPEGLSKMIRLAKTYGLPLYITENGIADAQDRYRSQYIIEHLKVVAKEIDHGAPIKGYFYWSLLDNFEWIKGYPPRFGLLNVDYGTMQRAIRDSARNYSKIIAMHRGYFNSPHLSLLSSLSF